ncbi:MAG TPA: saccharopine dehydrogenase C-terminal domain-containing protein [Candidatus Paceibacterota bacterium]|nr:saccharopine dehydrogenase C-terminal domain-containing protein [Candidatus Paceibacterota bacterium]
MSYDFLILGGSGMQGKITARDLLENGHRIFLADLFDDGAKKVQARFPEVQFEFIDLRSLPATIALIKKVGAPVVINCAESEVDLNVYKACLEAGKHVIDLGSGIPMTKKQIAMGPYFKNAGLTAITGCGSTPGINNIALHYAHGLLDRLENIEAGFVWDSNIKEFVVPFSIMSIIYEFTEPAPIIEDGKWLRKIPLETIEEREFREIGKQKIFLVRHPETYTFFLFNQNDRIKNVHYYAGFPDHSFNKIVEFIKTGQADDEKTIMVNGKEMTALEQLSLSLRNLPFPPGYTEKENLWVKVVGTKEGEPHEEKEILMETIVPTLPGWEDAGCNIDTGMPASIIAQMILDGRISHRGSFPPGPVVPTEDFFKELRKRQMVVYCNGQVIN